MAEDWVTPFSDIESGSDCWAQGRYSAAVTLLQGLLFATLAVMALAWFVCISRISGRLRERHPETYKELRLARIWPRNRKGWIGEYDNSRPVHALLRFLFRGEFRDLHDPDLTRISVFMRRFLVIYVILFLALVLSVVMQRP